MSAIREITGYNRNHKKIMCICNLSASFPPLKELLEIRIVDHEGKPYVYVLLNQKTDPELDSLKDTIGCDELFVDLNDIKEVFMMLTDDQRNIVMHIYYMYKNEKKVETQNEQGEVSEDNPKIILQGPAGTGKSTVIGLIEKLVTWEENKSSDSPEKLKVLKCAFTGKAASNIDGVTLNHVLSIPIYRTRSLNKKRLDSKKELLENCIFFICDEISMVGERLMTSVDIRLKEIFGSNKLYGDRFVLLVGDLYQIDPVRQKPVYPKSHLWTCCEFYELTKIIRQQDEKFINALNNFKNSCMTEEDVELFRSRQVRDVDQVPDKVIHLFYKNDHVDAYNSEKINKTDGREEIVNVIDDGNDWKPSNLSVKIGIRYMITCNMDVADGLANGTTGVVKDFDHDDQGVVVIWMEFHSKKIGRKTRAKFLRKHKREGFENWVPIQRSNVVVTLKSDKNVSKTVGNMFPLRAAEALTVHKSQGQTYEEGVCVHFTNDRYDRLCRDKTLQYVALTRVKRLEDLYIIGTFNFSVAKSDKFIRTDNELNRLRKERKLKLAFETFEDKAGDVIIYLNTGSTFYEHYQFITTDKWYDNGSLLIFTETNTVKSDQIDVPNFDIAFRSDNETTSRSGGGIICYKKPGKSLEVIDSISNDNNKVHLTLFLYEKYLYIVTGVKGDLKDDDFIFAIKKFFSQYIEENQCIFLIGDMDSNIPSFLYDFIKNMEWKGKLVCPIKGRYGESQCDMISTRNFNIPKDQFGFYEYIPSSHKPMFVKLPPAPAVGKCHSEVNSASYENDQSQQCEEQETMEVEEI